MAVYLTFDSEELAKTYDEMSNSQFKNGIKLIEGLGIKAGDKVLDVGCGTGRLGTYVADIIGPTGSIIGIDPLEERIKIANKKNQYRNATYKIGTAEDLSFIPQNSIDIVYLNAVFHWINNKEKALKEIFRLLKPGGKVGITTFSKECMNYSYFIKIMTGILEKDEFRSVFNDWKSTFENHGVTTTELIVMLLKTGFSINAVHVGAYSWSFKTAKEIIKHLDSSSFGNLFSRITGPVKEQVELAIESELEKYISKEGIKTEQHEVLTLAYKNELI